ncbi:MAG: polyprenyl diphosphate synthase, partial [Candidatus Poribacteria bacterium]|nr:polyprenyl diphosphate synthase [Candidatus Poribacteria bacterium]
IFSLDNFNREGSEVHDILNVIEKKMREMVNDDKVHRNQVRIRSMGKIELLPESLQEAIRKAEEVTQNYDKFILNVAVAYGGREEVVEAFRNYLISETVNGKGIDALVEELNVTSIASHLYTSDLPDPDLIIRTSGEIRLSGFLMWQSVYSEYYFCDTFWPAFRKIDFLRAIRDYNQRQRRYGQ